MRATFVKFGLALSVLVVLLPLLAGCGGKTEEKASDNYYTGPMEGKGGSGKAAGAKKLD